MLETNVASKSSRRPGVGLSVSVLAHAAVVLTLGALLGARVTVERVDAVEPRPVLLLPPAAAVAPPPPRGGAGVTPVRRPPTQMPPEPVRVEPAVVEPVQETPLQPEPVPESVQGGSASGSDNGMPGGVEGGREGGTGTDPNGRFDGCVGCDGVGPATDYDRPPQAILMTRPSYPPRAFSEKREGRVMVEILIDAQGRVVGSRLGRPRSHPDLEAAAVEAVRQWRFRPALRRGVPVTVWANAPVEFRIY